MKKSRIIGQGLYRGVKKKLHPKESKNIIQIGSKGWFKLNPFAYGMIVSYVPIRAAVGIKLNRFPRGKD
jgi:hypothetical protein